MKQTDTLKLKKPDYDNLADIEVLNENFDIIDENAKKIQGELDAKEPKIEVKNSGFNLNKTNLIEDDENKLSTAKAVFKLKDTLTKDLTEKTTKMTTTEVEEIINNLRGE
ncbi:MAG: hypothetical protein RR795_02740 [Cetobacterium sp.]|uniref:hypothetical protein n=1 Tax=Cetobacterium sp. TaxID=2071632 RepID=UPI002FC6BF1C